MKRLKIIEMPAHIQKLIVDLADNRTNVFVRQNMVTRVEQYRDDYLTLSETLDQALTLFDKELVKSKQKAKTRK